MYHPSPRIFGTTSSYIPELASIWAPLPMLVLGVPTIASACLALTLPETRGRPLPQTLEEALAIGIEKPSVRAAESHDFPYMK